MSKSDRFVWASTEGYGPDSWGVLDTTNDRLYPFSDTEDHPDRDRWLEVFTNGFGTGYASVPRRVIVALHEYQERKGE